MKVVLLQHRLLHYRVELFERLRLVCRAKSIDLHLVHGQATRRERAKADEGDLVWAHRVANKVFEVGSRDLIWQPLPASLRDADLVVAMQESRILSNYPLLLSRLWSKRRVAYWGHGKNFQSRAPNGLRERWKSWLLTKVDWWFAYTDTTVQLVRAAGYPADRITSLENAIDTEGFKRDLESVSSELLDAERVRLGLPLEAPVAIFCGSLYPDKRLELMIDTVDWIRAHGIDLHLLVVGDGPSMPFVRSAAVARPWVKVLGVQKGKAKALSFRLSSVMLNPGAVGLHVVDAFCAGLVMATTGAAMHGPEAAYLCDGENGIVVGDDLATYAQAVFDVLAYPSRMQAMREAALRDSDRYTLDNMVARFVRGIEGALASSRP